MTTILRLTAAGLLIILPARTVDSVWSGPFLLYTSFILTVLFASSIMRTNKERKGI